MTVILVLFLAAGLLLYLFAVFRVVVSLLAVRLFLQTNCTATVAMLAALSAREALALSAQPCAEAAAQLLSAPVFGLPCRDRIRIADLAPSRRTMA